MLGRANQPPVNPSRVEAPPERSRTAIPTVREEPPLEPTRFVVLFIFLIEDSSYPLANLFVLGVPRCAPGPTQANRALHDESMAHIDKLAADA
jgi:hypothetical protein